MPLVTSMFSSAGIGDAGLAAAGFRIAVANELLESRCALIALNHPDTQVIPGDAWENVEAVVEASLQSIQLAEENEIFLLVATPPCQGMSANGAGKLLNNIRRGLRPELDPRNRLIIPALQVAQALQPRWVVFENVVPMKNTIVEDEQGNFVRIVDLIPKMLGPGYLGRYYEVEMADYGLPQKRKRLITVYTRDENASEAFQSGVDLIPAATHGPNGGRGHLPWKTLREALQGFPPLDARDATTASDPTIPLHHVPVLDPKKYEWIRHVPENGSAFDNQCINPSCLFPANPTHGSARDGNGVNRAKQDTPLYCVQCGTLLPRPYVREKSGELRIMKGYTSAYKRMAWDNPAPTLTQNLSYPSSDHTLHPTENRVLSLAEASRLQSISDYDYLWGPITFNGQTYSIAPDTLIAECIGESVPPLFMERLGTHILTLSQTGPLALEHPAGLQLRLEF